MKIDRSRFLMLTGALSAATALGAGAVAGCSSTAATDKADASTTTTTDGGSSDGATEPADAGVDTGSVSCLDDRADGGDPDAGDSGLDCAGNADAYCQMACTNAFTNLKAGVAFEAAECVLKLPTCEGTTTDVVGDCFEKAGAKACADPTSPPFCQSIFDGCADAGADPDAGDAGDGGVWNKATCVALVNALNDTGRAAFQSCMVEGNGCIDPMVCVNAAKH